MNDKPRDPLQPRGFEEAHELKNQIAQEFPKPDKKESDERNNCRINFRIQFNLRQFLRDVNAAIDGLNYEFQYVPESEHQDPKSCDRYVALTLFNILFNLNNIIHLTHLISLPSA